MREKSGEVEELVQRMEGRDAVEIEQAVVATTPLYKQSVPTSTVVDFRSISVALFLFYKNMSLRFCRKLKTS